MKRKLRKYQGIEKAENRKRDFPAIVQLPLFGNPFKEPDKEPKPESQPVDESEDSLLPDYVKHRKKYGYHVDEFEDQL